MSLATPVDNSKILPEAWGVANYCAKSVVKSLTCRTHGPIMDMSAPTLKPNLQSISQAAESDHGHVGADVETSLVPGWWLDQSDHGHVGADVETLSNTALNAFVCPIMDMSAPTLKPSFSRFSIHPSPIMDMSAPTLKPESAMTTTFPSPIMDMSAPTLKRRACSNGVS